MRYTATRCRANSFFREFQSASYFTYVANVMLPSMGKWPQLQKMCDTLHLSAVRVVSS
jgi:hypothetical protein